MFNCFGARGGGHMAHGRRTGWRSARVDWRREVCRLSIEQLEPRRYLAAAPLITEFLASNDDGLRDGDGNASDWIEIRNAGDMPANLGGYYLTDDQDDLTRWRFPNVQIAPGEHLIVFASNPSTNNYIDAGGNLHTSFALGASGEYLALVAPDGTSIISEFDAGGVDYPAQFTDISYGLSADGSTVGYFLTPTPGAANGDDALVDLNRRVLISEIMYHPAGTSDLDEFIEIDNAGDETINLNGWRFSDGVEFTFPERMLGPGERLVVAADLARFQANHAGIANVVGGWSGHLSNHGERIRLVDGLGRLVDSVTYADQGDWSIRARGPDHFGHQGWIWLDDHDGGGKSLELISAGLSNDHGQNWAASSIIGGTPGTANSMAAADVAPLIGDTMHGPAIPRSSDPVTVTSRLIDELTTGMQGTLFWRVDGAVSFNAVPMLDNGSGADRRARDGVFSAAIPPQANGTIVEFFVQASDQGGLLRTWPAATSDTGQVANLLYQVDDSFDPNARWLPTNDPIARLVMTEAERAELADIGDGGTPPNEQFSDAQMNGTFIYRDGTGLDVRYNVGIRNRGNGTRRLPPNNYRINIPTDRTWEGVSALNINSKYTPLQVLGGVIYNMAGIPMPNTNPAQVRVNGANLAETGSRMFGRYAFLEVVDSQFADNHFAPDPDGNLYEARRPSGSMPSDLSYLGTDATPYRARYFKESNQSVDDWSDLIHLTDILNNAREATYVADVSKVANIRQWLRFLALEGLTLNTENGISNGEGDDYDLYRGVNDPRFVLIPHDLDTILGKGDSIDPINRSILLPAQMAGLSRFLNHPEIRKLYYVEFQDLIANVFNLATLGPLLHQYLDGWATSTYITEIETFITNRTAAVMAQIPAIVPTQLAAGPLAANTTLDAARGPWLVMGDVVVPAGVTLTIEAGVTVYFAPGAGIDVAGRLVAEGSADKRIVLTRPIGATTTWDGLQFNSTQQDNRLAYVDMSVGDGRGQSIRANSSRLTIDNMTWSGTVRKIIEVQNPSLRVTNSIFPAVSNGETIHGTAPQGTPFLILEGNTFHPNTSGDDVIDLGPAQGATPPVQIRRNIFLGGGDDGIDLDGVDSLLEENVFMNFHLNTTRNTTSNAVATGIASGLVTDVTLRRNIFVNNDHHVLLKEQAFVVSDHNVYFDADLAAIQFTEIDADGETAAGRGGTFSGDIFWQNVQLFKNIRPGVTISVNQSLVPSQGLAYGSGNVVGDPLFVDASYRDFHLQPLSPAIGSGPSGIDMGAYPNASHKGIVINEVLAYNVQAHNVAGTFPDLVELYNRGTLPVDLGGMSLTDDPAAPMRFVFPADTMIAAGGYLTLIADTQPGAGLRLGFALDNDGEGVYLFDRAAAGGALVDSLAFGMQIPDYSVGRVGPDTHWALSQPTIGEFNVAQATGDPTRLRINEWFANGDAVLNDDFVELFNSNSLPVALRGLSITDDPVARPLRHRFAPLSVIAANGFVALTADENTEAGPNHLDFRLTGEAGRIALVQTASALAGDYNGNGAEDAADVVVWRKSVGQFVAGGTRGDGDENGFVDQKDYDIWRANFGRSSGTTAPRSDAAVPYWAVPSLRLIDFVSYVAQTTDVSQGRVPDGIGAYQYFTTPTPGQSNVVPSDMMFQTPAGSADAAESAGAAALVDGYFERIGTTAPSRRPWSPVARDAWVADELLLATFATRRSERSEEPTPLVSSERVRADEVIAERALTSLFQTVRARLGM
jgi:CotH kinase protein/Lamin Tail Domain/Right handed beta helix region